MIEFINCGNKQLVNSIYDCNLVGNYNIVKSILSKCKSYGNMMVNHIYKEGKTKTDENTKFLPFADILGQGGCGGHGYGIFKDNNTDFQTHICGEYQNSVIDALCRRTTTSTYKVYGTKEELENWKYFTFNNKLPLFLNIVLTIGQNNNSKNYVPWLTDKRYTDNEIYTLLNIAAEEQKLIDKTIEKFERKSSWFKRYMTGDTTIKTN